LHDSYAHEPAEQTGEPSVVGQTLPTAPLRARGGTDVSWGCSRQRREGVARANEKGKEEAHQLAASLCRLRDVHTLLPVSW